MKKIKDLISFNLKDRTPEQVTEDTKKELNKYGLEPIHKVSVTDPLTGITREITIDRTGYGENKLIVALADPNLDRDKKDHVLSMYLWERGKESASFLVDLMRYKGEHTKETRAFKSQVRFDFEILSNQFSKYIREQARLTGVTLGIDINAERTRYKKWVEDMKQYDEEESKKFKTYIPHSYEFIDFVMSAPTSQDSKVDKKECVLIAMAINSLEEGERMVSQIQNVMKAREREKGKGIYVDRNGRITTYDDPDLDDIIKKDRDREDELKNE